MKNKEFFKNCLGFTDNYKSQALSSAILVLMGGGKLLIRKPGDIKTIPENVIDLPEGIPFTGGGLVVVENIFNNRDRLSSVFVYVNDINKRMVELFDVGVVVEGNWVKMCKSDDWNSGYWYDQHLYLYPRIVDAIYMHILSGNPLITNVSNIGNVNWTDRSDVRLFHTDEICVEYDGDVVKIDDLRMCAEWCGDVFEYNPENRTVTIKPQPESQHEEEEE